VRHTLYAGEQNFDKSLSVVFILHDEGAVELGLQFLEVVVSALALLVPDSYDHEFELVHLADWLRHLGGWLVLVAGLHLLSFHHLKYYTDLI